MLFSLYSNILFIAYSIHSFWLSTFLEIKKIRIIHWLFAIFPLSFVFFIFVSSFKTCCSHKEILTRSSCILHSSLFSKRNIDGKWIMVYSLHSIIYQNASGVHTFVETVRETLLHTQIKTDSCACTRMMSKMSLHIMLSCRIGIKGRWLLGNIYMHSDLLARVLII